MKKIDNGKQAGKAELDQWVRVKQMSFSSRKFLKRREGGDDPADKVKK